MRPSLWFVVPVAGRLPLAAICLKQLRRTCDDLVAGGVDASAVIVIDRGEFFPLRRLMGSMQRFGVVFRDNRFVGRRFNDGIQLATDSRFNPRPVDFVVPCGSDDWVDHRLFLDPLPQPNEIIGFQRMSFVNEDATEIAATAINYRGGSGIRIIPRQLVAPLGYRPCDEDRARGCDTSILTALSRYHGDTLKVRHFHLHDRQIVDWKTRGAQLNPYREVTSVHATARESDPFEALADFYPAEALDEIRALYGVPSLAAA